MIYDPSDQIIGFSYSFCRALIGFLRDRIANGPMHTSEEDEKGAKDENYYVPYGELLPEIAAALYHLTQQMGSADRNSWSQNDIHDLMDSAEKFLAIFEKKQI